MLYKKPKMLIWSDTPTVPTGFGIVAKNLFRDLHEKYEVDILGINYHGDTKYDTNKWFIYSAAQGSDFLGVSKMDKIIPQINPDVIVLFQDIFNINRVWPKVKSLAPGAKIIIYFPVDGTPFNFMWSKPLQEADAVITYTQFAKDAILDTFPHLDGDKILTLDHGIDTDVFKPLPAEEIRNTRLEVGWDKKFVILNLNRFQPRKLIPLTLRAALLFTKGYHKCKCGNWYWKERNRCDLNGCSLEDVVETVEGRSDTLLYLHMIPYEPSMGPGRDNMLMAHALNAGYRDEDLNKILQINDNDLYKNPLSETALNKIYNAACVNISTTLGEGFGFSLAESAASGTISIAPRNSAVPEVLGDTGHLVNNVAHCNMPMDNGHVRPVVSVPGLIDALEIEYIKWLKNKKEPVKDMDAVERVKRVFNWDDKRKFLSDVVEEVLKDKNFLVDVW